MLGAKAQKEAFPGVVYPGEIPGNLPIAFRYSGNFTWNAKGPPSRLTTFPTTLRSAAKDCRHTSYREH
jgi:hypothetical protein